MNQFKSLEDMNNKKYSDKKISVLNSIYVKANDISHEIVNADLSKNDEVDCMNKMITFFIQKNLHGDMDFPKSVAYKLSRYNSLCEIFAMLGTIEEQFGRHSKHNGAMLCDKYQRDILSEVEILRTELRYLKIIN